MKIGIWSSWVLAVYGVKTSSQDEVVETTNDDLPGSPQEMDDAMAAYVKNLLKDFEGEEPLFLRAAKILDEARKESEQNEIANAQQSGLVKMKTLDDMTPQPHQESEKNELTKADQKLIDEYFPQSWGRNLPPWQRLFFAQRNRSSAKKERAKKERAKRESGFLQIQACDSPLEDVEPQTEQENAFFDILDLLLQQNEHAEGPIFANDSQNNESEFVQIQDGDDVTPLDEQEPRESEQDIFNFLDLLLQQNGAAIDEPTSFVQPSQAKGRLAYNPEHIFDLICSTFTNQNCGKSKLPYTPEQFDFMWNLDRHQEQDPQPLIPVQQTQAPPKLHYDETGMSI